MNVYDLNFATPIMSWKHFALSALSAELSVHQGFAANWDRNEFHSDRSNLKPPETRNIKILGAFLVVLCTASLVIAKGKPDQIGTPHLPALD